MTLATLLAAIALQSSPAPASIADCVVGAVPPAATQEMISRYKANGPEEATKAVTDTVIQTVVAACAEPTPEGRAKLGAIGEVLAGHAMMQGAQGALLARHKVSGERLEQAWSSLSDEEKGSLLDESRQDDANAEALMKFIVAIRPDVTTDQIASLDDQRQPTGEGAELMALLQDASYYWIGRSILEAPDKAASN